MVNKEKAINEFDLLLSKIEVDNNHKKMKNVKKHVFQNYNNNTENSTTSIDKRDTYKTIYFIMKMMKDKTNNGKNKLREILYREKDVKTSFLDGFNSLWDNQRNEVQNIFFVLLVYLTMTPIFMINLFQQDYIRNSMDSLSTMFGMLGIKIIMTALCFVIPFGVVGLIIRKKVNAFILQTEVLKYLEKKVPDFYLEHGINKVDFLYHLEKVSSKEKNRKILDEIIRMEEDSWVKKGINKKLNTEMAIKYQFSLMELMNTFEQSDVNEKIAKIRKYKSEN